jgi:hypothetical protein
MVLVDATHSDLWKRLPPELSKPPDKQPLARFPILAGPAFPFALRIVRVF